jgi:hypothetical protein
MRRTILSALLALGATAALAQNVNPGRLLFGPNGVPTVVPNIIGTPTTTTTPASTYVPQVSALPNVLFQIDAGMPPGTAAAVSGTPGFQVDASNNVLAASLPGGIVLTHGYGESLLVADGWSPGRPVLRNTSAQVNNGYDSLLVPLAAGGRTVQAGQSSVRMMAVRQTAPGLEFFRTVIGGRGVHVFGANSTDCALRIEVNLGSALATEPSGPATACGQRQILTFVSNDSNGTITLLRNGVPTVTTPGGQVSGWVPDNAELLNSANVDLAWYEEVLGIPTTSQLQSEQARLAALYPVDGTLTAITFGPATAIPPVAVDLQSDFLTTVNMPTAGGNGVPFPKSSNIALPAGLAYESGATQVFGAVFGTDANANIKTTQDVYNTFYTTTMEGNIDQAVGSPMDTGQGNNSTFYTVLRTYPPNSPNNLHVIAADGLHLRAACSGNRRNCGPGQIYGAGAILSQLPIHPGMSVHYRRKSPAGDLSWAPAWLFSINVGIPPVGNTSLFSTAAQALNHNCGKPSATRVGACQEIDIDDGFSRKDSGTTTGLQINHGYPDIYGGLWERNKFPHLTYAANGGGYVTHLNAGPDYEELPFNQATAFHDTVFDWRPDGTMNLFVDGKIVLSGYQDFTKSVSYVDGNGILQYVGMQLMLMNQAVPGFAQNNQNVVDNNGLGVDGWAPVYQSLEIVNGNIANPQNFLASTTNAYAGNTGNPSSPAGTTWTVDTGAGVTRVLDLGGGDLHLETKVGVNGNNGESSLLVLIGLSTSSTVPPSCSGPEEGAWTCFGTAKYFVNTAGTDWRNFRQSNPQQPALPAGTYYVWVQTPDGVNRVSTTPYVK